jgi:hypothetical protein
VPCINHAVNLVFSHLLTDSRWHDLFLELTEIISLLRSSDGIEKIGERCPGIVQTRWLYAVDSLYWILKRRDAVNEFLILNNHSQISDRMIALYWTLLPLQLFSLSVERNDCCLCNVIPMIFEVQHQYRLIQHKIEEIDPELLIFINVNW